MTGTLYWNFCFALFGFSLYFFLAFPDGTPGKVLLDSFLTAAAFFFLMSGIRKLIHLGMEKPPAEKEEGIPVIPEAGHIGRVHLQLQIKSMVRTK
ncbi:hypothetical protein FZC84_06295 [Rossellomorea vietnamensis]|uniref:Uncharacterized protein n=1 Tax=Rossellomorea vietnamensis TaxID=218284 RepID=A0A5D4MGG5_9BACI|nr:hypothetical protein [Rossellomorea vietnamensis]TYS00156.1 hypothetical protein FZC84_06295 [Rossellomorea vietnamensis]